AGARRSVVARRSRRWAGERGGTFGAGRWGVGHDRDFALERRALQMALVGRVVERCGAVLGAAIVPEERIPDAPVVPIDELRPGGEFLQVADKLLGLAIGHAFDLVGPAADIERGPAR